MSLLMEALKKAEEAKRQAGEGQSAAPPARVAHNRGDESAAFFGTNSAPDAPAKADDFLTGNEASAPRSAPVRETHVSPPGADTAERNAARNLLAAKQAPANHNLRIIVGAGIALGLVLGTYFWWQLRAVQSPSIPNPSIQPLAQARPEQAAPPVPAAVNSAPPAPPLAAPSAAPRPSGPARALGEPAPAVSAKVPRASATPAAEAASETPVRLSRAQPKTDPVLDRAYDHLQAGRLDDAQRDYERVLRVDGKNTDALLGLATLAAQLGQVEKAQTYYLRALESDPSDPTARAGVISTRGQADTDAAESRLKTALGSQPESPSLLFALGNLYARQGRWSEAQQTYFQAYAAEPDNPDIIFNLAVSLDHLRQSKLAAQYYQMALNAGGARNTSFDRALVRTRLLELQP